MINMFNKMTLKEFANADINIFITLRDQLKTFTLQNKEQINQIGHMYIMDRMEHLIRIIEDDERQYPEVINGPDFRFFKTTNETIKILNLTEQDHNAAINYLNS